jgi:hypothetical protein
MNTLFVSALALSNAASGAAAPTPASAISPLSPIYACAEKTDPAQRLACFDAAVAAVKAAEARSEIITMDKPRVEAVRREAFGFRIPSLPKFSFGGGGAAASTPSAAASAAVPARDEEDEAQNFSVARIANGGNGRVMIYLDNGNVWQTVDAGELNAPRQMPFNVRIRTAAMGSFMMTIEGRNKGYRVRRVQ